MTTPKDRALAAIAICTDAKSLRQISANAKKQGEAFVERAAMVRLFHILPSAQEGTVEYDVWRSIHALEEVLTSERSRTTRLGRTRQKIAKVGEIQTVTDLILGKASEGFDMLVERDMVEFTFEQIALLHPTAFPDHVISAAKTRIENIAP